MTTETTTEITAPETMNVPAKRRGRGTIARLPKVVRDQLNEMIQDGVSYLDIIRELGDKAKGLNEDKLSRWKQNGYLQWLRENEIAEALENRTELVRTMMQSCGSDVKPGQAALQVLASNLCELLAETNTAALRDSLVEDADKFTRFMNALVRMADGELKYDLHKEQQEDRKLERARLAAPKERRGITEESLRLAEERLNLM